MLEWLRNLCAETFQEKWRGKVSVATLALTNQLSIRFVESVCSGNLQESGPWNFLKPNDPKVCDFVASDASPSRAWLLNPRLA